MTALTAPHQDVLWVTDEDEIAANEIRLRELTDVTARITSHYLQHDLRHLRCGTTKSDDGSRQLEDLASISDLVAGAVAEGLTAYRTEATGPLGPLIVPPPRNLSAKTVTIMDWFATNIQPLKRLVYIIEPVEGSSALNLKQIQFHGLNDHKV